MATQEAGIVKKVASGQASDLGVSVTSQFTR